MAPRAALLTIFIALLAACGTPKTKPAAQQRTTSAPAVPATADADSLAALALKAWATNTGREHALPLAQKATEREPQRADLLWLQVRLCVETKGCEPERLESRLRKLDPGNGAAWIGPLARAQARRDTRAEDEILDAMGRAERVDLYWNPLVSRLSVALRAQAEATAQHPLTDAMNDTVSWVSSIAVPALNPITSACDQQDLSAPARVARCQRIAEALQRSDTTLMEGAGLAIAQRLAAPGSPTAAVLAERVARLSYQNQAAGSIVQAQVEREKFSAQMIELMKKLRREQEVSNAILRWAGQPTTPPR